VAHFVPPDIPDPSGNLPGKASVIGVALGEAGRVVITDQNSGLYVLTRAHATGGGSVALYLGLVLGGVAVLVAAGALVARRRASAVDA
jgi:hypothetical protein